MNIGIVTVLYKSANVISGFVDSLNSQSYKDFKVVFVENEVEDFICEEYIKKNAQFNYEFIRSDCNVGVASGNNVGIDYFLQKSPVNVIHFMNNDVEFGPEFLQKHYEILQNDSSVDALAPKMYYYAKNNAIWYAGGKISFFKSGPRHFGHNKKDKLTEHRLYKVDYAPTCSLMIRSDKLRQINVRMWENLFVYYDDYVFCYELKKNGVSLYYVPYISLNHKVSSSSGGSLTEFSRYYMTRNHYYVAKKLNNLFWLRFLVRILYNGICGKKVERKALIDALKMQ